MVILPLSAISWIALAVIVGSLAIAWWKKITITYALIISNFLVFFISIFFYQEIVGQLGFRPIYLELDYLPQLYTLFSSMFVHADLLHILGNMFIFFFMGIAFEDRIGRGPFLLIYLVTGICGAMAHSMLNLGSTIPLIGASGAIFGIMGAFAYAYPWDEIVMPIPVGIMIVTKIKVLYATILFALLETVIVIIGSQDSTAHFAHLGGLVAGVVIAAFLVRGRQDHLVAPHQRPSPGSRKEAPLNTQAVERLATTPEMRSMLSRIEHETVPQVRDMWLDHFFEKARCPVCGKPLQHDGRKVWCFEGHFQAQA
jgi:membrane associated rhomboid family serine protease